MTYQRQGHACLFNIVPNQREPSGREQRDKQCAFRAARMNRDPDPGKLGQPDTCARGQERRSRRQRKNEDKKERRSF
jgi:hypothetical protein